MAACQLVFSSLHAQKQNGVLPRKHRKPFPSRLAPLLKGLLYPRSLRLQITRHVKPRTASEAERLLSKHFTFGDPTLKRKPHIILLPPNATIFGIPNSGHQWLTEKETGLLSA